MSKLEKILVASTALTALSCGFNKLDENIAKNSEVNKYLFENKSVEKRVVEQYMFLQAFNYEKSFEEYLEILDHIDGRDYMITRNALEVFPVKKQSRYKWV